MLFQPRYVTLRSVLATSWSAKGLVRAAWLRLAVEKGHREELARLTGIPATNLSAMNTGKRPMTGEMAARIVAAVPGITQADLGAPEEADAAPSPAQPDRQEELERSVLALTRQVGRLARRVAALERQAQPEARPTRAAR